MIFIKNIKNRKMFKDGESFQYAFVATRIKDWLNFSDGGGVGALDLFSIKYHYSRWRAKENLHLKTSTMHNGPT